MSDRERILVEQVPASELKPGDQAILVGPRTVHACDVEGVNDQWTYLRWEDEQSAFPGASKTVPSSSPVLRVVPSPSESDELPSGVELLTEPWVSLGNCCECDRETGDGYTCMIPLAGWKAELDSMGWEIVAGRLLCFDCAPAARKEPQEAEVQVIEKEPVLDLLERAYDETRRMVGLPGSAATALCSDLAALLRTHGRLKGAGDE
jgi:hypothetical protein